MKRLVVVGLLLSTFAWAHAVDHPRRIAFRTSKGAIEVRFVVELDPVESSSVRRLFDRNRDGILQENEAKTLRMYLEKRAVGSFEIRRRGKALDSIRVSGEYSGFADPRASLAAQVIWRWEGIVPGERLSVWDEGDSQGHVPVIIESSAESIRFGAVKVGSLDYDLPARTAVSLVLE